MYRVDTSEPAAPPSPPTAALPRRYGPRWLVPAATVGALAAASAYVYRFDPNVAGSPYPTCLFKATTGLDCPGCGGTRCAYALLHGDVRTALDHNALLVLLVPIVLYQLARWALAPLHVELPPLRLPSWARWAIPVAAVAFTILRNIPGTPLRFLDASA